VRVGAPWIAPSAYKHGVEESTILHAFNNPIRSEDLEEGMVMLIGADQAGNLYELGVIDSEQGPVVVHAMAARRKYLP